MGKQNGHGFYNSLSRERITSNYLPLISVMRVLRLHCLREPCVYVYDLEGLAHRHRCQGSQFLTVYRIPYNSQLVLTIPSISHQYLIYLYVQFLVFKGSQDSQDGNFGYKQTLMCPGVAQQTRLEGLSQRPCAFQRHGTEGHDSQLGCTFLCCD